MKLICLGLFFIYFDIPVEIGSRTVGILPAFVGYLIIIYGVSSLKSTFPAMEKLKSIAGVGAVLEFFCFLLPLLNVGFGVGLEGKFFLGLQTAVPVVLTYHIVNAIRLAEKSRQWDLRGGLVLAFWVVLTVCNLAIYVVNLTAMGSTMIPLVGMVICLVFLGTLLMVERWQKEG